jgi:hypothetical protein
MGECPWRGHQSSRVCPGVLCPSGGGGVPQRRRPIGGDALPSGARGSKTGTGKGHSKAALGKR